MNENRSVGLNSVISGALWLVVFLLLAAAWIGTAAGAHHLAMLLGFTSCVLTGCAAVFTLRCSAARSRALMRSLYGLGVDPAAKGGGLYSIT